MRRSPLCCAAIAISLSGCLTTERLARPPAPGDLARVNDAARSGSLSVIYALPPRPDAPQTDDPKCAGGGCGLAPWARDRPPPVAIAAANERTLTLVLADGQRTTVPLGLVAGVDVSGTERLRHAGLGALTGGVTMFGLAGMAWLVANSVGGGGAQCDSDCRQVFVVGTLGGAAVGALVGAFVGTTRRFYF